jgi:hypothetical protein
MSLLSSSMAILYNIREKQGLMEDAEQAHQPDGLKSTPTGYGQRCRGRFAPSTIAAYYHPLGARRSAPHNQRMQQTIPSANKFASGLAPDPRRFYLLILDKQIHYCTIVKNIYSGGKHGCCN